MTTPRDVDAILTAEAYRRIKQLQDTKSSWFIYGKPARDLTNMEVEEFSQKMSKDFLLMTFNKWFDQEGEL